MKTIEIVGIGIGVAALVGIIVYAVSNTGPSYSGVIQQPPASTTPNYSSNAAQEEAAVGTALGGALTSVLSFVHQENVRSDAAALANRNASVMAPPQGSYGGHYGPMGGLG